MSQRRMRSVVCALVAFCIVEARAEPYDILGVEFTGRLIEIDSATGAGNVLGQTGLGGLNALARDSTGRFISAGGTNNAQFVSLDFETISATPIFTLSLQTVRGLAFSPDDVLYGVLNNGTGDHRLYRIDLDLPAAYLIGQTGYGVQALAFSPEGVLYGWDGQSGLLTIDTDTGIATRITPLGMSEYIQSLCFGPDGTLYGGSGDLWTIDVDTGIATAIGSGDYTDARGIEFVPEPSTIVLILPAVLLARGRRSG